MLKRVLLIDQSEAVAGFLRYCLAREWPDVELQLYPPNLGIPAAGFHWSRYDLVLLQHQFERGSQSGLDWLRAIQRDPTAPSVLLLIPGPMPEVSQEALLLGSCSLLFDEHLSPRRVIDQVRSVFEAGATITARAGAPSGQAATSMAVSARQRADTAASSARDQGLVVMSENGAPLHIRVPGYRIVRQLAAGGMALVLLAERTEDGAKTVLKILSLQDAQEPEQLKRFMREYGVLSGLSHPHVVQIHERGFAAEFAYIAMEYLPHGDLKSRIERGLPAQDAVSYLSQIAQGLRAVHAKGIVHRDLKPSNVLFRDPRTVAVGDFGIAKDMLAQSVLTVPGFVLGTPYYTSPEQIRDEMVDVRSDVYSLGVLFFQMLTGGRPFDGRTAAELLNAHTNAPIPRLPEALRSYQPIVDGMLAKDPDDRFQSADELLAGLNW